MYRTFYDRFINRYPIDSWKLDLRELRTKLETKPIVFDTYAKCTRRVTRSSPLLVSLRIHRNSRLIIHIQLVKRAILCNYSMRKSAEQ